MLATLSFSKGSNEHGGSLVRLCGRCLCAVLLALVGSQAAASADTWWPAATVFPIASRIGLAANREGGMLIVDGRAQNQAAFCAPAAKTFVLGGPAPAYQFELAGYGGRVIPGSPSFEPDGRSVGLFMSQELHSEPVSLLEGPSAAPAALLAVGPPPDQIFQTNTFVLSPSVVSNAGPAGDIALAGVGDTRQLTTILRGSPGTTEWSGETLPGYPQLKALAVDGLGDTTVLAREFSTTGNEEPASAFFARRGQPFTPLSVPGSYFTSIASGTEGRTAIAGYTASGPQGPGLYLSRRESSYSPFGEPVLLSRTTTDSRPALAYDGAGNLTVAWSEAGGMAVATATPGEAVGVPQFLSAPSSAIASDEQLAVEPGGEAVLVWAGGAHDESNGVGPGGSGGPGLQGAPAPLLAAVRPTRGTYFEAAQELAPAARYSEGLYANQQNSAPRAIDAIGGGRAMVAWLEQGASGPEVKTALYASQPGCATPPTPVQVSPKVARPRLTRAGHPHRDGHHLVLGYVSCTAGCSVATRVLAGPRSHRRLVARSTARYSTSGRRVLTATLTTAGLRLLRTRPRAALGIEVRSDGPAERPVPSRWTVRLVRRA